MISLQQWQSLEALTTSCSERGKDLLERLHALLTVDSLTQGLEALDPHFSVELLALSETDDYYCDLPQKRVQLCRKVQLQLSHSPVIYAESHCSMDAKTWTEYLHCGTSSLGRRLFSPEAKFERSPFRYALFTAKDLSFLPFSNTLDDNVLICARRSFFIINQQSLFITEWYLPALIEKINHFTKNA